MLTDTQRKLFSEILDLNWDFKQEKNPAKKMELFGKLTQKKIDLKKDMGDEAYDNFMSMGQKMFS